MTSTQKKDVKNAFHIRIYSTHDRIHTLIKWHAQHAHTHVTSQPIQLLILLFIYFYLLLYIFK